MYLHIKSTYCYFADFGSVSVLLLCTKTSFYIFFPLSCCREWYLSRVTKTCKIINFDNYFYYICTWCCTIITTTQNPFNFTAKLFTVLATKIIYFWHNGHLYFGAVFTIDKNSTENNKILSWGESHTSTHSSRKKLIANPTGKTQYGMSDLSPINSPLLFFELGIAVKSEV